MQRRKFMATASAVITAPSAVFAQSYPRRPIRLLVGYPAGGPVDIVARLIGQWLTERLGQQVVIDNKPGAGSNIATDEVVRAPPDGHTLLVASSSNAINATLYKDLRFEFVRDVSPVCGIARVPAVLEVTPSFAVKTVPEFIAYAKANPGKINVAAAGPGSQPHLCCELFMRLAEVELTMVQYRGSGPALPDLAAGQVQAMFDPMPSSIGYIRAGKLRPLAVTTASPSAALPDVPPIGQFVAGYEANGWQGIVAPRNTPREIIDRLNREINAGCAEPGLKARLADLGALDLSGAPDDFAKYIADETAKWGRLIREAKITPQ